jgi:hypothetical protein
MCHRLIDKLPKVVFRQGHQCRLFQELPVWFAMQQANFVSHSLKCVVADYSHPEFIAQSHQFHAMCFLKFLPELATKM